MSDGLDAKQRGFLLLNIYVLAQQGYIERAATLAEAMHHSGDRSVDVTLARLVLAFMGGDHPRALALVDELDRIDPVERFGEYRLTDRQRMRRYIKARCLFESGDKAGARDAVDSYLRHGKEAADAE